MKVRNCAAYLLVMSTLMVCPYIYGDTTDTVSFRVMSYNVGGGAHIPSGPEQIEQIADEIVDNAIDIVGITELDAGTALHQGRDMVSELGVALAKRAYYMHHYYEPAFQHSGGWAVHAIFSRWAIRECGYRAVKGGAINTGRWVMGHVGVDVAPGTRVHFFMTHFWPWTPKCEPEVAQLFAYPAEFHGPKVIMGDFNAAIDSPTMKIVQDAGFANSSLAVHGRKDLTVGCSAGIAAPMPLDEQIDYIMGSQEVRFIETYVPYTTVSDHWPIVAIAEVARGNAESEWAGDEQLRPHNFRFEGDQLSRDRAMDLYRHRRYGDAAKAMAKLEENSSEVSLKSFYAFSAATMRLLDGDKLGALESYSRLFARYPPSKWTAWGHHRSAFLLKDLGRFAEAEEQFIAYMRDYMTVLHPTVTTVAAKFAFEQIVSCRKAQGLDCSVDDVLRDLAGREKGVVARAAHYRLSLDAWHRGDDIEAARHYQLADLKDDVVEDDYLTCVARGWIKLGKLDKLDKVDVNTRQYLAQLSVTTARFKKAEWEIFAHPDKYEVRIPRAISARGEHFIDWDKAFTVRLKGDTHVYRISPGAADDLSAELRLAWTPTYLHIRFDVRDWKHSCPYSPEIYGRGIVCKSPLIQTPMEVGPTTRRMSKSAQHWENLGLLSTYSQVG